MTQENRNRHSRSRSARCISVNTKANRGQNRSTDPLLPVRITTSCLLAAFLLAGAVSLATCVSRFYTQNDESAATLSGSQNAPDNVMSQKLNQIASNIVTISKNVTSLQDRGYQVGFATDALTNGINLSYHSTRSFYSASSIKGPYVLATIEHLENIPPSCAQDVADAIENSDNDAYFNLYTALGVSAINAELDSIGASDTLHKGHLFIDITPAQLCDLWKISYPFAAGNSVAAQTLRPYFTNTARSQITTLEGASTWSKAGWIVEEDPYYNVTVDAGIVSRENLVYCMAVMTNKGEDFDAIAPIINALDAIEQDFA